MLGNNIDLYKRAKENSIGTNKKEELKVKRKNVSKKILASLFAVLISLSLCACYNNSNEKTASFYNEVNMDVVNLYLSDSYYELDKIIKDTDVKKYYKDNSIEQYMQIKDYLREEDMLIYYNTFGKGEIDDISKVMGYENFNDFLIKNEYVDEEGNPSFRKLQEETYLRVTQEYEEKTK